MRDSKAGKPHYTRILSPLSMMAYGEYMLRHSIMKDGTTRSPDNWKKGMDRADYIDSMVGHAIKAWFAQEIPNWEGDSMKESLCAVMFNAQGRLHELLKEGGK